MEEKKGNSTNKLLIILVVLLSLLVGGFGGYIVFSNISDSKNFNKIEGEAVEEEKKEVVKDISIENEFVQKMFKMHKDYVFGVNLIDDFYGKDTVLISNLSDESKKEFFLNYNLLYLQPDNKDDNHIYYNSDRVLNEWKKLFGSNANLPVKGNLDEFSIGFFDEDGSYRYCNHCGIGDIGPLGTNNTLLRATRSDNEIVLYEAVKFLNFNEDTSIYYKDYDKKLVTTNDAIIDANYKFIYKYDKQINNYYFYAVERIK